MTLISSMRGMLPPAQLPWSAKRRNSLVAPASPCMSSPVVRGKAPSAQSGRLVGKAATPKGSLPGAVADTVKRNSPKASRHSSPISRHSSLAKAAKASPVASKAHLQVRNLIAGLNSGNSSPTTIGCNPSPLSSATGTTQLSRASSAAASSKQEPAAVAYFSESQQRCGKKRPSPAPLKL